jgi:hypothetical protein
VETIERSSADRALTARDILSDLRSHQVDGVVVAEIRRAAELEEQQDEHEALRWIGVVSLGLILAVLLALWCRGVI